jgi:hypothetical protein
LNSRQKGIRAGRESASARMQIIRRRSLAAEMAAYHSAGTRGT